MKFNMKLMLFFLFSASIILVISCRVQSTEGDGRITAKKNIAPKTEQVDLSKFTKRIYVSERKDGLQKDGSKENPYASINDAVTQLNNLSKDNKAAILVSVGIYSSETIKLKEYVTLYGGFNSETWERDIDKYETVFSGKEGERIIVASDNTTIDGFTISNAKFRGKGAAIYCDGTSQ